MVQTLPGSELYNPTGVEPGHGPASGGTTVVISGTGDAWPLVTEIFFGDNDGDELKPATGFRRLPNGDIQCVTPAFRPGKARVTAKGGRTMYRKNLYTYTVVPAPSVDDVTPTKGPGGIGLTVKGSGFREGHTT